LNRRTSKNLQSFGNGLLVSLALVLITVFLAGSFFPRVVFKNDTYVVSSGSMVPELKVGDLIVVDPRYPLDEIEVGDVITYLASNTVDQYEPTTIVHRVVSAEQNESGSRHEFVTKGDSNLSSDLPISDADVTGKVLYKIPFVGFLMNSQYSGDIILVLAVLMVVFGFRIASQRKKAAHGHDDDRQKA
jgi:signal peptidase